MAAIAGDQEARQALVVQTSDPLPSQPDLDPPSQEFLVLDADASQSRAINRVLAGESVIIWGPPGTGKSQTIANLVAALVAHGLRVLFVAQKRAAIDVVAGRLRNVGLAELLMDIHGGITSRRQFALGLDDAMRRVRSIPQQSHNDLHLNLSQRRDALIQHKDAMHEEREPWGVKLFDVQEKLMGADERIPDHARMRPEQARALNRQDVIRLMADAREWVDLGAHELRSETAGWSRSSIDTPEAAQRAYNLVTDLHTTLLPETQTRFGQVLNEVGIALPDQLSEWPVLGRWLSEVAEFQNLHSVEIYGIDAATIKSTLGPPSWWRRTLAPIFSRGYRRALRSVRDTARYNARISADAALALVGSAADQKRRWRELGARGDHPQAPANLGLAITAVAHLIGNLNQAEEYLPSASFTGAAHAQLADQLRQLAQDRYLAMNMPRIRALQRGFTTAGLDAIIEMLGGLIPTEFASDAVEQAWLRPLWEEIVFNDPRLSGFTSAVHDRREHEFMDLDHRHLERNSERVRRAAAEMTINAMNAHAHETTLVHREAAKRSRYLPVRQLLRRAPHVLTTLYPCWAMSPLLVAELIPAANDLFDVVIFDEASQIPPAEAIGTLARAPQAVVAGDDRQLPPTNFFTTAVSEDEDENEEQDPSLALTTDIESILDVAKAGLLREELLQWHYRSRDGRLIAFSNSKIYDEALTTFPSTERQAPITFHPVPFRALPRQPSARSHPDEVTKVVDMIVDHAHNRPEQSLGVITFGIHHANNIDEALRSRLRESAEPILERFLGESAPGPFFVKNIERVQGDERDVVILSIGYHKQSDGTLAYRFGPLNQAGGERRLNVAISRARNDMHVVSSFSHRDMEPGRSNAVGVEFLREYLESAETGGIELETAINDVPLNAFELDVLHRLRDQGVPATARYGVAGYRIDFACAHPDQPGRMVLAIEADGANYHSGQTARDRDRLRQEILESKGWQFHRIWSTDWFRNRDTEVDRAVAAWRRAVSRADGEIIQTAGFTTVGDGAQQTDPVELVSPTRGTRPNLRHGRSIQDYLHHELVALVEWILSDTLLRTDEELMAEMRRELGFRRRGSRIDAALGRAIAQVRA